MSRMDTAHLAALTDDQLRAHARDAGVRSPDTLHRTELIRSLAATDHAMTRSEERLVPGTEVYEVGRARLRKYVVTEDVQITVRIRREELRLETEAVPAHEQAPVADPDVFGAAEVFETPGGGPIFEVTLHEERPLVSTEIVPVERVRLVKVVQTEDHMVSGPVRKERIEVELPGQPPATLD